jgi:HK97 family phage major capsid protein
MTKAPFAIPMRPDFTPRSGHSISAPHSRPSDAIFRALAVAIKYEYGDGSAGGGGKRTVLEELKAAYGEDDNTRLVMARLITKAAVIPADTTTSGWASNLVQTAIADLIESLLPLSVYPQLVARGDSFTFGQNGAVTLPARNTSTSVSGAFIAQGNPIPVKQGAFSGGTFTTKKMGVITTVTREILLHSTPSIENILRKAVLEDTSVAIDALLLDATAADSTRPAGLKSGVVKVTANATASIVGFIADIKGIAGALITGAKGNLRAPVWIMNPLDVLAALLLPASTGGALPFVEEMTRGRLLNFPIIQSSTCAVDTMFLVDAADFATATGEDPQYSISDQAVLHMEDTAPAAIVTGGTVATPVRSMFQTDCLAIKMLLDINWGMRRTGVVQWSDTLAWN